GVALVVVFFIDQPREIPYTAFRELVDAGQVKKVAIVGNERVTGEVRPEKEGGNPDLVTSILKKVDVTSSLPSGKFSVLLPYTNDRSGFADTIEKKDRDYWEAQKKQHPDLAVPEKVLVTQKPDPSVWVGPIVQIVIVLALIGVLLFFLLPKMRDP